MTTTYDAATTDLRALKLAVGTKISVTEGTHPRGRTKPVTIVGTIVRVNAVSYTVELEREWPCTTRVPFRHPLNVVGLYTLTVLS